MILYIIKVRHYLLKIIFTKLFLFEHNTKVGVYRRICVAANQLKFYGFSERRGLIAQEMIIPAGESAISPPEYWHKVAFLTQGTAFKIKLYAHKDSDIIKQKLSERN